MRRFRSSLAMGSALAALFVGMATVGTPAGAVTPVGCGAVITTNTTLTSDVGPCNTGDGLTVKGSNFVLNLNGHRVFSDAPLPRNIGVDGDGIWIPADVVGIKLVDARGVTVRNGTVERFNAGVSIEGGASNTILSVTSQNNQGPCIGENFSSFAVGQYGDGIVVFGSPNNRLANNTIRNNGPFSGIALVANNTFITTAVPPYPSGNNITGNLVEDNSICFADIGIRLEGPGASNSKVTGNTVRRSFQEGIVVHPVNVIDFKPLFQSPPACQNRGFPGTQTGTFTTGSPVVTITGPNFSAIKVGDPLSSEAFPAPFPGGATVTAINAGAQQITMSGNATQTGTFPFSTLPQCPIQHPLNPTNDNNTIANNVVSENGFGGVSINAGPNEPNAPSTQVATGINLLSFCGYGARSSATGNIVQSNTVTHNAGNGVAVGGCPLGQNPANGTFPGFTDTKIIANTSVNNNQRGCGTLPPTAGCGSRPTTKRYDLINSNNVITCPSTSATTQAMCATLGFAPPPATPTPFVGNIVVQPGGQPCDNNTWLGNKYLTAAPPCTAAGGTHLSPSTAGTATIVGEAAGPATAGSADDAPRPLRGKRP